MLQFECHRGGALGLRIRLERLSFYDDTTQILHLLRAGTRCIYGYPHITFIFINIHTCGACLGPAISHAWLSCSGISAHTVG